MIKFNIIYISDGEIISEMINAANWSAAKEIADIRGTQDLTRFGVYPRGNG